MTSASYSSAAAEPFEGLRIRGVAKTFGTDTTVLNEIDLDVHPGELISLVGSSGTGKSTLLRIIAGLEEPSAGRVTYAVSRWNVARWVWCFSARFCTRT
ncbi:ATP-binding cassette domain-containing protein [Rothia sp. HMSC061C12]|uniref:ATP-binding cassette domain-containing protein n=1 Tax=Rothia sp. HMSC061C12 TaxID=1739547 RepID=UPI002112FB9C|nr:ATP-binding cassette domain-containing protein [Rothia sp. HMSC061C12]